jgi:DNA gyrase/topoisomerase IV subunit A
VNEGDRLGWARVTNGENEILIATAQGMAIRFSEEAVRPMGLAAAGVMGLKLREQDEVVGMELLPQEGDAFLIASDGTAKRVKVAQFPVQGRYGQGVAAWKLPDKIRVVGMAIGKGTVKVTVFLEKLAPKSVRLDEAPLKGRPARGKRVIELKVGDSVVRLSATVG